MDAAAAFRKIFVSSKSGKSEFEDVLERGWRRHTSVVLCLLTFGQIEDLSIDDGAESDVDDGNVPMQVYTTTNSYGRFSNLFHCNPL